MSRLLCNIGSKSCRQHKSLPFPKGLFSIQRTFWTTTGRTNENKSSPIAGPSSATKGPLRISYAFGALLAIGVGATGWGLYEFYSMLTMWPEEVRGDLRAGLRAKHRGDLTLSERFLCRAWETVRTLPLDSLSPEPFQKLTGVAISLAEVLEAEGKIRDAYDVYNAALSLLVEVEDDAVVKEVDKLTFPGHLIHFNIPNLPSLPSPASTSYNRGKSVQEPPAVNHSTNVGLSDMERSRIVELALKLDELSDEYEGVATPEEQERALLIAAFESQRLIKLAYSQANRTVYDLTNPLLGRKNEWTSEDERQLLLEKRQYPIPSILVLSNAELSAPFERLGNFYARRRSNVEADSQFTTALNILTSLRTDQQQIPLQDHCRAAQVALSHSASFVEAGKAKSKEKDASAESTFNVALLATANAVRNADQALAKAESTKSTEDLSLCKEVSTVGALNCSTILEMLGKVKEAKEGYLYTLALARENGFPGIATEAQASLRSLEKKERGTTHEKPLNAVD